MSASLPWNAPGAQLSVAANPTRKIAHTQHESAPSTTHYAEQVRQELGARADALYAVGVPSIRWACQCPLRHPRHPRAPRDPMAHCLSTL